MFTVEVETVESTEAVVDDLGIGADFSIGGLGLTNVVLLGILVFLILVFSWRKS